MREIRTIAARAGLLLAGAAALAGCAPRANPTTYAVPAATAAEIRMRCPPGSFMGAMTVDCPQAVK